MRSKRQTSSNAYEWVPVAQIKVSVMETYIMHNFTELLMKVKIIYSENLGDLKCETNNDPYTSTEEGQGEF